MIIILATLVYSSFTYSGHDHSKHSAHNPMFLMLLVIAQIKGHAVFLIVL